jgi:hypothetical protein
MRQNRLIIRRDDCDAPSDDIVTRSSDWNLGIRAGLALELFNRNGSQSVAAIEIELARLGARECRTKEGWDQAAAGGAHADNRNFSQPGLSQFIRWALSTPVSPIVRKLTIAMIRGRTTPADHGEEANRGLGVWMQAADLPLQEATMRVAGFHPEWRPPRPASCTRSASCS